METDWKTLLAIAEAAPESPLDGEGRDPRILTPSGVMLVDGNPRRKLTDDGNALLFVDTWGHLLRHVAPWNRWLVWTGTHWREDDANRVLALARETARLLYAAAPDAEDNSVRQAMATWALRSQNASRVQAAVKLATSDDRVVLTPGMLDALPGELNLANGTLDLASGALRPHDPNDNLTQVAPVSWYGLEEPCPLWETFVEEVLPDPEVRAFVQRALGYTLMGRPDEQALFFMLGRGRNGKDTLLGVVSELMGDYATVVPETVLMATRGEQHPAEVAKLFRKRLALRGELKSRRRFDEGRLKELTGGGRISARRMREDFWEFDPTHVFWLLGNERPQVDDTSYGFWQRLHVVPFPVEIPPERRAKGLGRFLAETEGPGILAWLVRGAIEYGERGLAPPTTVRAATDDYRKTEDLFGAFLDDCVVSDPDAWTASAVINDTYRAWCDAEGVPRHERIGPKGIGARLKDNGYVAGKRDGRRGWHGLRIVSTAGSSLGELAGRMDT